MAKDLRIAGQSLILLWYEAWGWFGTIPSLALRVPVDCFNLVVVGGLQFFWVEFTMLGCLYYSDIC
jgi:hypothetical protein